MTKGFNRKTEAVIAIVAGILVLVFPNLLSWIVGLFFIIHGILALR